jgi:hypothetical protein
VGFVVGKVALEQAGFFPRVLRFPLPANLHSTNFSTITITYHLDWYNRPVVAAKAPPH